MAGAPKFVERLVSSQTNKMYGKGLKKKCREDFVTDGSMHAFFLSAAERVCEMEQSFIL